MVTYYYTEVQCGTFIQSTPGTKKKRRKKKEQQQHSNHLTTPALASFISWKDRVDFRRPINARPRRQHDGMPTARATKTATHPTIGIMTMMRRTMGKERQRQRQRHDQCDSFHNSQRMGRLQKDGSSCFI